MTVAGPGPPMGLGQAQPRGGPGPGTPRAGDSDNLNDNQPERPSFWELKPEADQLGMNTTQ